MRVQHPFLRRKFEIMRRITETPQDSATPSGHDGTVPATQPLEGYQAAVVSRDQSDPPSRGTPHSHSMKLSHLTGGATAVGDIGVAGATEGHEGHGVLDGPSS